MCFHNLHNSPPPRPDIWETLSYVNSVQKHYHLKNDEYSFNFLDIFNIKYNIYLTLMNYIFRGNS